MRAYRNAREGERKRKMRRRVRKRAEKTQTGKGGERKDKRENN